MCTSKNPRVDNVPPKFDKYTNDFIDLTSTIAPSKLSVVETPLRPSSSLIGMESSFSPTSIGLSAFTTFRSSFEENRNQFSPTKTEVSSSQSDRVIRRSTPLNRAISPPNRNPLYSTSSSGSAITNPYQSYPTSPLMNPLSPSMSDVRSVPSSRRNSGEVGPLLREIEKISLGEEAVPIGSQSINNFTKKAIDDDNSKASPNFPYLNEKIEKLLFDDENDNSTTGSSYVQRYLQMNTDDDKFPILVRRDSFPGMLSASSAALDLASALEKNNSMKSGRNFERSYSTTRLFTSPVKNSDNAPALTSPKRYPPAMGINAAPVPRKAFDVEALTNKSNLSRNASFPILDPKFIPQPNYQLHRSQSVSPIMGPDGLPQTSIDAELLGSNSVDLNNSFYNITSSIPTTPLNQVPASSYSSYDNRMYVPVSNPISPPPPPPHNYMVSPPYLHPSPHHAHNFPHGIRPHMSHHNSPRNSQKRVTNDADVSKFSGAVLETFIGDIYSLCKDQHGCRYLQKKLDEKNEKYVDIIFKETSAHFVELMTDPFGNYLCQKLMDHCQDDQRTVIVRTVSPQLVNISLNMHGTRAVQRMIESLSNKEQISSIISALQANVVPLIKDLNGNHVIQKCLHKLKSVDNQFIYDAVSLNCIEVATHRHGCCVFQRCIDHASDSQKEQLVREVTNNALTLVQDPFGNYVVQYILDLNIDAFTHQVIQQFIGNVCALSIQKFSSNVMEKCIKMANTGLRHKLIEEMLFPEVLTKLLKDSYANYVVQTSLECAEIIQKTQLIECIKPLLPEIRNTPYGKRIQSRIQRELSTLQLTATSLDPNTAQALDSNTFSHSSAFPVQVPNGRK